jgi:hypothetical protein
MKLRLVQTSPMCPEQYDAFDENNTQVGYLRLRHGIFSVDVPDAGGRTIYEAVPKGDGAFEDDERGYFLEQAKKRIKKAAKE